MIDLRKHFEKTVQDNEADSGFVELLEPVAEFLSEILTELKNYGFTAELDLAHSEIKDHGRTIEFRPRLILRYQGRKPAEPGVLSEHVDLTFRSHKFETKQGAFSAFGVGKTVEEIETYLVSYVGSYDGWQHIYMHDDNAPELAAQIIVSRFAKRGAHNDKLKLFKELLDKNVRAANKTQKPGWSPDP